MAKMKPTVMRTFKSRSTRSSDTDKIDPEAALSPLVIQAYCEYVRKHRHQGSQDAREDDNWQLGIPPSSYMKSLWRHLLEAWRHHRGFPAEGTLNDVLCAIIFNAQGMLHERLKDELSPIKTYPDSKLNRSEDFSHENGNYFCRCVNCGKVFIGHKRRPVCKICASIPTPISSKTTERLESQEEWREFHENMKRAFLPNEDDYRDLELRGSEDLIYPQSDPKKF